jgi:hypothetical protein
LILGQGAADCALAAGHDDPLSGTAAICDDYTLLAKYFPLRSFMRASPTSI